MSTYEFVMKQRALHSESTKSKKEPSKEIQPKPKAQYFSNLKETFLKNFRTNNKIQSGEQEIKAENNKEIDEKTEKNGIDPKNLGDSEKKQLPPISTISNGITTLSSDEQTNHAETVKT